MNDRANSKTTSASVVTWLTDGARSANKADEVLAEICDRLCACGIPLWRVEVFVRTLHPDIIGRRFRWQAGSAVSISATTYELSDGAQSRKSLIEHVCADGRTFRRELSDSDSDLDFPLLRELRNESVTDVLATPLIFTDGDVHAALWTTRQPGGFADEDVAAIKTIVNPLARVAEVRALRRTATNLLDTYVGGRAGERILAGRIRRGYTESINAAIWLSDMRGFTSLSDRVAPQVMIDILNRYFDCQVPSILNHGGEVLKFMGDGLLAMFPIENAVQEKKVCSQALTAGLEARARISEFRPADADELKQIRFGLALHIGDVLYGNIGGGNRLDFTCIGPAVNLAARLEKIAADLGRTIVTSSTFAAHFDSDLTALGEFAVRGLGARQVVFGLDDES